ncbi:MAG TPA: nuclear transport factor 2 family protein [Acidobacteriaceae bacterium]|jgi:limonene-1,2-epoxide hydrolase|nr:nuclear transport factor 2 family protein [Acidobacteriaceae bacterium]
MPNSPVETAGAFVAAINAGDLAALRALMTDDHAFTDARGNNFSGIEEMIFGWQYFFSAYPAHWIHVDRSFTDGTRVALFGEAGGKWRVGERVLDTSWTVAAAWLAEVESGKIRSWSIFCDTAWADPPQQEETPHLLAGQR